MMYNIRIKLIGETLPQYLTQIRNALNFAAFGLWIALKNCVFPSWFPPDGFHPGEMWRRASMPLQRGSRVPTNVPNPLEMYRSAMPPRCRTIVYETRRKSILETHSLLFDLEYQWCSGFMPYFWVTYYEYMCLAVKIPYLESRYIFVWCELHGISFTSYQPIFDRKRFWSPNGPLTENLTKVDGVVRKLMDSDWGIGYVANLPTALILNGKVPHLKSSV